jgi:synaptobrevin family protein YKT6
VSLTGNNNGAADTKTNDLAAVPYTCHVHVGNDGLAVVAVTTNEYKSRLAFNLIRETSETTALKQQHQQHTITKDDVCVNDKLSQSMLAKLNNYNDPTKFDKLSVIQKSLDDVKIIMTRNIDDILKRGETLTDLMQKSTDLSEMSLQFHKNAKKTNQCCKAY